MLSNFSEHNTLLGEGMNQLSGSVRSMFSLFPSDYNILLFLFYFANKYSVPFFLYICKISSPPVTIRLSLT